MKHPLVTPDAAQSKTPAATQAATVGMSVARLWSWLSGAARWALLGVAAVFFILHFLHLTADFPNNSPWVDWAKYTDEGWYGDGAIRHYLTGHWYWPGDFNPAVALPVWPALEWVIFRFTGASVVAARSLTLCVFALTLLALCRLIARHTRLLGEDSGPTLAGAVAVFLLCASPFVYVFERMAILEPLLVALGLAAMLAASHLDPPGPLQWRRGRAGRERVAAALPALCLGLLLPAMVLTKTTGVCLFPAIAYMVWARAGYRLRAALRLTAAPAVLSSALWCAYFFGFVRPHYLADYRYLFTSNAYVGVDQPFASAVLVTLADCAWMGLALSICFVAVLLMAVFWRPRFFRNPLVPSFLLWIGGYAAFLIYHNNLQPRYYLVLAIPVTAVVALGLDFLRRPDAVTEAAASLGSNVDPQRSSRTSGLMRFNLIGSSLAAAVVLAIAIPDALLQCSFIQHPSYDFEAAAQGIKRIVLADQTQSHLILSISGSDLTLMTGLPSIDDDFGTLMMDQRVAQYRPGWYVAWNEVDDDKADALSPFFSLQRVAAFPAMDDPDRNLLILYRLNPVAAKTSAPAPPPRARRVNKSLAAPAGQRPSPRQREH